MKFKRPGTVMGIFAFGLEATGVASGAYEYGAFPLKLLGVPLMIPFLWILITFLAHIVSEEHGVFFGILVVWSIDVILEPIAYHLKLWQWVSPYSYLVVPFGTVANAIVWVGMAYLGIRLWGSKLGKR